MKNLLTICVLPLTFVAPIAHAADFSDAIPSCKAAIGKQMNVRPDYVQMKIKRIKTRSGNRIIKFVVTPNKNSEAPSFERVSTTCTVRPQGKLVALEFADNRYPAVNDQNSF